MQSLAKICKMFPHFLVPRMPCRARDRNGPQVWFSTPMIMPSNLPKRLKMPWRTICHYSNNIAQRFTSLCSYPPIHNSYIPRDFRTTVTKVLATSNKGGRDEVLTDSWTPNKTKSIQLYAFKAPLSFPELKWRCMDEKALTINATGQ
jgi:hypothetical protein